MTCPVCSSSEISFEGTVDKYQPPLSIQRCRQCMSLFQYPLPENHDSFYDEGYYSGQSAYSYIDERKANRYNKYVWDARIRNIRKFQDSGIYLDVGCSFGGLVRSAAEYFDSYGIDISDYSVTNGNEFSLDLCKSSGFKGLFKGSLISLPDSLFSPGSVSVITMIEVIEHLANPREHVESAYKLLKPGGILVIQTANMSAYQAVSEGLKYHYYLPGHLSYFSREGLAGLLKNTGFKYFKEYMPTDFSLFAKLKKLSGSVNHLRDYMKYFRTIKYHWLSYIKKNRLPRTSSYVIYAFK